MSLNAQLNIKLVMLLGMGKSLKIALDFPVTISGMIGIGLYWDMLVTFRSQEMGLREVP